MAKVSGFRVNNPTKKKKSKRIMSVHINESDKPDSMTITTEFHKQISGGELLQTFAQASAGMISALYKLGNQLGMTQEMVSEVLEKCAS